MPTLKRRLLPGLCCFERFRKHTKIHTTTDQTALNTDEVAFDEKGCILFEFEILRALLLKVNEIYKYYVLFVTVQHRDNSLKVNYKNFDVQRCSSFISVNKHTSLTSWPWIGKSACAVSETATWDCSAVWGKTQIISAQKYVSLTILWVLEHRSMCFQFGFYVINVLVLTNISRILWKLRN